MLLHKLARELMLDYRSLYDLADKLGLPSLDPNVPVPREVVERLRAHVKYQDDRRPPPRSVLRARRLRGRPKQVKTADMPLMAKAVLRAEVAVMRPDAGLGVPLPNSIPEDRAAALNEIAAAWGWHFFTPEEVERWLTHGSNIDPDTAAALRDAGISAEVAATPLWYGHVDPGRRSIAVRVSLGDLTAQDAAAELRAAGLLGGA